MLPIRKNVSQQSLSDLRHFDDLVTRLNPTGRYQLLVLMSMMLCLGMAGATRLSQTLAGMPLNHKCVVNEPLLDEDDGCWYQASSDQCSVQLICNRSDSNMQQQQEQQQQQPEQQQLNCSSWSFSNSQWKRSIVSQFGLVCDSHRLVLVPQVAYSAGAILGSLPYGMLADACSRQVALVVSLTNIAAAAMLSALVQQLWLYSAAQMLSGIGVGGLLVSAFVTVVEATDSKHRHYWAFSGRLGQPLGFLIALGLAALLRDHCHLLLVLSVTSVCYNVPLLFLGRSPRWLAARGMLLPALASVHRMASINQIQLPRGFSLQSLCSCTRRSRRSLFNSTLGQKTMQKAVMLMLATWLATAVPFHGVYPLNIGRSPDSARYAAVLWWLGPDLVACCLGLLAGRLIGRRALLSLSLSMSLLLTLAMTALNFTDAATSPLAETAASGAGVAAKIFLGLSLDSLWLMSCELSPTWLRASGLSLGSALSSASALSALLLLSDHSSQWRRPVAFVMFSAFCAAALVCSLFLNETQGKPLIETNEEGVGDSAAEDAITVSTSG